jgi:hypothetical protein
MESVHLQSVLLPNSDLITSKVADAVVILHLSSGRYYSLDGVGVRIWELLQEKRSLAGVCAILEAEFGVDASLCRDDLLTLCRSLCNAGLVVVEGETNDAALRTHAYRRPVLYEHGPLLPRPAKIFSSARRPRRLRRLRLGLSL